MADTPRVTVPVDDLAGKLKAIRDKFLMPTPDKDFTDYAIMTRCIEALTAAPVREEGGAVDGPEDDELPGDFLARVGMDGALWADGFRKMALKLGYSDMDEGWLIGWFCNAVMAGYDHAQRRFDPALATREEAPAEAGERETLRVLLDNMVIAQSLSKELRQRATDEARSYLYALRAQPPAREDAQPVAWRAVWRDGTVYGEPKNWPPPDGASTYHGLMSRTIQPLYTHPAPDALRVAVEALEPFARAADGLDGLWSEDDWRWNDSVRSGVTVRDIRHARQALVALQAEQKGSA